MLSWYLITRDFMYVSKESPELHPTKLQEYKGINEADYSKYEIVRNLLYTFYKVVLLSLKLTLKSGPLRS